MEFQGSSYLRCTSVLGAWGFPDIGLSCLVLKWEHFQSQYMTHTEVKWVISVKSWNHFSHLSPSPLPNLTCEA